MGTASLTGLGGRVVREPQEVINARKEADRRVGYKRRMPPDATLADVDLDLAALPFRRASSRAAVSRNCSNGYGLVVPRAGGAGLTNAGLLLFGRAPLVALARARGIRFFRVVGTERRYGARATSPSRPGSTCRWQRRSPRPTASPVSRSGAPRSSTTSSSARCPSNRSSPGRKPLSTHFCAPRPRGPDAEDRGVVLRRPDGGLAPDALPAGRVTYDLRRLRLHGEIERQPKRHRYRVTDAGLRLALFLPRVRARTLFGPGW